MPADRATETESLQTLDAFVAAMRSIREEALKDPELVHSAPHSMPVRRLDDVRARASLIWPGASRNLMQRDKPRGATRLFRAFGASMKGFKGAWIEEAAFRQEVGFAVVALPLGLWLGHTGVERALLAGPVLLVLVVELLNSAIEATVDRLAWSVMPWQAWPRTSLRSRTDGLHSSGVTWSLVLLGR